MICNEVQTVGALGAANRGFIFTISPAFDKPLAESECTFCGQCVAVCPVGALTEVDHTHRLIQDLNNASPKNIGLISKIIVGCCLIIHQRKNDVFINARFRHKMTIFLCGTITPKATALKVII